MYIWSNSVFEYLRLAVSVYSYIYIHIYVCMYVHMPINDGYLWEVEGGLLPEILLVPSPC